MRWQSARACAIPFSLSPTLYLGTSNTKVIQSEQQCWNIWFSADVSTHDSIGKGRWGVLKRESEPHLWPTYQVSVWPWSPTSGISWNLLQEFRCNPNMETLSIEDWKEGGNIWPVLECLQSQECLFRRRHKNHEMTVLLPVGLCFLVSSRIKQLLILGADEED